MDDNLREYIKKYMKPKKSTGHIPVSGKVYDEKELANAIEAVLEGWWTDGIWVERLENGLKDFLGVKNVILCNSGSSANLLAIAVLRSHSLGERRIKKGDEIITVAAGFPTTINPIIQTGCVPVFIDIELGTYNLKIDQLEKAISKKTKAVFLAHTLGNPYNVYAVKQFCTKYNLWLIEDNCDALGSKYNNRFTGTFGDLATLSFYPAHHITTVEGGGVITNSAELTKIIRSIRDWGRHCWCPTGRDNTCKNRYNWKHGNLPEGYDHKYVYGEIGYNFKMSDIHAAIGVAQLEKLPSFIKKRKENFRYLHSKLQPYSQFFILPEIEPKADPSWFGYLISIREDCGITRTAILKHLEAEMVGTRLLFSGNIICQPYFVNDPEIKYRVIGKLRNSNLAMNNTFWIGLGPQIDKQMIDRVIISIDSFLEKR